MEEAQFVPQTGTKKDDQETRKVIRRHVMLGKNAGKIRPRKPEQLIPFDGCAVFRKDDWKPMQVPERNSSLDQSHSIQSPSLPRRVGSDLSFLTFAEPVDHPLMHDTLQFCTTTDNVLFRLAPCISFDSTDFAAACIQFLSSDPLHLNVMVFSTQAYINQIFWQATSNARQYPRKAVLHHYGQALSLLRTRLIDAEKEQVEISDVTIISIITLATHALATADIVNARSHISGLRRLVSLKDQGIYSFRNKSKQMIEMLRCDLSVALTTGMPPLFFADPSYEPFFPLPAPAVQDNTSEDSLFVTNDELSELWHTLRSFSVMMNEAAVEDGKLPDQVLAEVIASVMYRLLHMPTMLALSDEAVRLAMISFCPSTILAWRQLKIPFIWLKHQCKHCVTDLIKSSQDHLKLLWYLVVYVLTFSPLPADEVKEIKSALVTVVAQCNLSDWSGVQGVVKEFLWIDIVYDDPARKLVEEYFI